MMGMVGDNKESFHPHEDDRSYEDLIFCPTDTFMGPSNVFFWRLRVNSRKC